MADTAVEPKKDILESEEWQKAVDYEITDEDIERQRALLGFDQAAKTREYIQTATEDNIRNFAHGCGDDNPLFTDPDYARKTRWGGIIAPGMMTGVINRPMLGDPVPDEIKRLKLAPGAIVMVSEGIDTLPKGQPIQLGLSRFAAERVELVVMGE